MFSSCVPEGARPAGARPLRQGPASKPNLMIGRCVCKQCFQGDHCLRPGIYRTVTLPGDGFHADHRSRSSSSTSVIRAGCVLPHIQRTMFRSASVAPLAKLRARIPVYPSRIRRSANTRLHPWPKTTQDNRQIRQAPIQAAQPHRDHVWQAQGLEARGDPLRLLSQGLPRSHRPRSNRHLLVMNPEPSVSQVCYSVPVTDLVQGR